MPVPSWSNSAKLHYMTKLTLREFWQQPQTIQESKMRSGVVLLLRKSRIISRSLPSICRFISESCQETECIASFDTSHDIVAESELCHQDWLLFLSSPSCINAYKTTVSLEISGHNLQLVGDLRGQMLVLQDWPGIDASLRWAGPSMKVQDFWSPGVVGCTGLGKEENGRMPASHMETRCIWNEIK